MVWDWNEDSDHRVGDMWQMMKRLSDCREVIYSKWYQGRATFFSHESFRGDDRAASCHQTPRHELSETARVLFEVLENNSPLSTKELKELTDLQGRVNESIYNSGMKELFTRLLIVGFGEVEDGAFPSLAVGATELLFEELWRHGADMSLSEGQVHAGTIHADRLSLQASLRQDLHYSISIRRRSMIWNASVPEQWDREYRRHPGAWRGTGHQFALHEVLPRSLPQRGLLSVQFNFEYMENGRKIPDPQPKMQALYRQVVRGGRGCASPAKDRHRR